MVSGLPRVLLMKVSKSQAVLKDNLQWTRCRCRSFPIVCCDPQSAQGCEIDGRLSEVFRVGGGTDDGDASYVGGSGCSGAPRMCR